VRNLELVLGIDTSNYTTSMCAVSCDDGHMVSEARRLLPVGAGERGLRQSDALFFHVQQFTDVMSSLMRAIPVADVAWRGIGVSVRPRPLASSYMPVFLAGTRFAESFAWLSGIAVVRTSHQEGHLAAADYDMDLPPGRPFLAVHLSGGTSDVLCAVRTRFGYQIESLGSSSDLNAGQFVDRVGVALGLSFPAGPQLERLAASGGQEETGSQENDETCETASFRLSATVKGANMSFSGPCSAALRAVDDGVPGPALARAVFACIANSLVKAIRSAALQRPDVRTCVLAGGVMANMWIRQRVVKRLGIVAPNLVVRFANPRFSSDNALGVATIAYRYLKEPTLPSSLTE
jgi:N6-L-threonylcarbamoyladenine synthase